ncbi:Multi antimicrobial extrusion protein like protein [Aduncisulcus paluster]|uniref:Multi antimicrobial extrusion protein like protein n=1 Tax=Aduncisulcus paluster TaxID=2918883 RepID=A0ABQ5KNV4_9EUKA|nr:Multi antimicrobial extrusion protein like protein [Aduncisulcus paluster]
MGGNIDVVEAEIAPQTCCRKDSSKKKAKIEAESKRHYMLASDEIFKTLMTLSIPSIISMGLNAIYNVVDSMYLGRSSSLDLAAVSLFMVVEIGVFMSLNVSLGFGASSVISPALGKGDFVSANKALTYFISLLVLLNCLLPAIFIPLLEPILEFLGANEYTMERAKQYGLIMSAGPIGYGLTAAMGPMLRVENKATLSMWRQIFSSVLNIIFDPILIFALNLGTQGAAISTVSSQMVVGIYMIWFYFFPKRSGATVNLAWKEAFSSIDWPMIGKICSLGLGQFFASIGNQVAVVIFNRSFKKFLDFQGIVTYQAVMGAMARLSSLVVMPAMGINLGFIPLIGYNIGRNRYDRVYKALKYAFAAMILIGGGLIIAVEILGVPISKAFGTEPDFLEVAPKCLRISVSGVWLYAFPALIMGYYQVQHKIAVSLALGISQPIFSVAFAILFPKSSLGVEGVFYVGPAAFICTTLLSIPVLFVMVRDIKKKIRETVIINDEDTDPIEMVETKQEVKV